MSLRALLAVALATAISGCASSGSGGAPAEDAWNATPGRQVQAAYRLPSGRKVGFLLFVPREFGTDPARRWPLLFFLHGSGESGTDLERVKLWGPPQMVESRPDFPFVLASPQVLDDADFDVDALDALRGEMIRRLPIDPDRVLVTGLSLGGYAAWTWAIAHRASLAAIAPIAGGADPARACAIRDLPAWAFHGAADDSVPIHEDQRFIDALRACGGTPRFTIYPDTDHAGSWVKAYADPELYAWLLAQRRSASR
jgi:predicted peptidase